MFLAATWHGVTCMSQQALEPLTRKHLGRLKLKCPGLQIFVPSDTILGHLTLPFSLSKTSYSVFAHENSFGLLNSFFTTPAPFLITPLPTHCVYLPRSHSRKDILQNTCRAAQASLTEKATAISASPRRSPLAALKQLLSLPSSERHST